MSNKYDDLIRSLCKELGWNPDPLWIKAQVRAESAFNQFAVSPVLARGLLQLMPQTDETIQFRRESSVGVDKKGNNLYPLAAFDPERNLYKGIKYMVEQYTHFPEILDPIQRIFFADAAFNCGRGNVNRMLRVAQSIYLHNEWQDWDFVSPMLEDITFSHASETWNYVKNIRKYYKEYTIDQNI